MSDCQQKHGWKWIGAPQNGVLGLFPPPPSPDTDSTSQGLPNEGPPASNEPVQAETIDPPSAPLAIRLVFLVMELVFAHAAGLLFVWCGSITKTIARHLTGSSMVAETLYCVVVSSGILVVTAKLFQQQDIGLFAKRLGLLWTPFAMIAASIIVQGLLLVYFLQIPLASSDRKPLWPPPLDDKSLALALRSFVFAPLEEELFFRGLVLHLALNRLEGPRRQFQRIDDMKIFPPGMFGSIAVSSLCFAGVHLANLRHAADVDVVAQLVWGLALGVSWAFRFVLRGSLLECVALHSINNAFAAGFSTVLQANDVASLLAGALTILAYYPAMSVNW